MLKVLVNAYAISPDRGSEPGMGWNWCVRLAKECELFIITEGEFRVEIERELGVLPQAGNMHFYYLPVSKRVRRMCWHQGDWRFYFYYALWQRRAFALARELCNSYRFDIIHQLNMVGFREPGLLWKIKDVKFILGPIGGMTPIPVQYYQDASWSERMRARLKNVINHLQILASIRVHKAIASAEVVICATPGEQDCIRRRFQTRTVWISETGTSVNPKPPQHKQTQPYHLIWVGRFMYQKQLGLALKVMSALRDSPVILDVVGSGSPREESLYHGLAKRLQIEDKVIWHGQVSHEKVGELLSAADVFFFTSVYEATSTVCMEAISHGLPIICFDTCGFGPLVDDQMGIKIPLSMPEESIALFAEAIRRLIANPEKIQELSRNAFARVAGLTWDAKIQKLLSIYDELVRS